MASKWLVTLLLLLSVAGAAVISGETRCESSEDCREPGDDPCTVAVCVAGLCYQTQKSDCEQKQVERVVGNRNGQTTVHICQTFRDLNESHADMQLNLQDYDLVTGIVQTTLGSDETPVLSTVSHPTVQDATSFYDWYHDTDNNCRVDRVLEYTFTPGESSYELIDDGSYFEMDGVCFGNEENKHNFHFTEALKVCTVAHEATVTLSASSDDDLFVFVNGDLQIDIGGVHEEETQYYNSYDNDHGTAFNFTIFYAERHTTEAVLRLTFAGLNFVECCGENGCCEHRCCSDTESSETSTTETSISETSASSEMPPFTADSECEMEMECVRLC